MMQVVDVMVEDRLPPNQRDGVRRSFPLTAT